MNLLTSPIASHSSVIYHQKQCLGVTVAILHHPKLACFPSFCNPMGHRMAPHASLLQVATPHKPKMGRTDLMVSRPCRFLIGPSLHGLTSPSSLHTMHNVMSDTRVCIYLFFTSRPYSTIPSLINILLDIVIGLTSLTSAHHGAIFHDCLFR